MKKINIVLIVLLSISLILCTKTSIKETKTETKKEIVEDKDQYGLILKDFSVKTDIYNFIRIEKEEPELSSILAKMSDVIDKITKESNKNLNTYWELSKNYETMLLKNYKKEEAKNINIKQIDTVIDEYSHKKEVFRIRIGILKSKINEDNEINFGYIDTLLQHTIESINNFKNQKAILEKLVEIDSVWIPKEKNSFKEYIEEKRKYLNYVDNEFNRISNSI